MEIGESIGQAIVREVREETGLEVEIDHVVGIYSDPHHVFAYDDGEVRQEFSVCFACNLAGGALQTSAESTQVGFFEPEQVAFLDMHESVRRRIRDHLSHHPTAVIA
jgi:ADP-ribose pyrophosphatase YjhB (NUDIX family)